MQSFEFGLVFWVGCCFFLFFKSSGPEVNSFCIFFSEEKLFLLYLMLQVLNSRIMPKLCMDHYELS